MRSNAYNKSKLDYLSECLPGSVAEQKEKERLEEFHRAKALRLAEEARNKPLADAQREQKYLEACKANAERNRARGARRDFIKRVETPAAEQDATPSQE